MKVVYLTNILNHYQKALCDEFASIEGVDFNFIATVTLPEERRLLKIPDFNETTGYCVCAYKNKNEEAKAFNLFMDADIAIFGMVPKHFAYFLKKRKLRKKIVFYAQERNYKTEPRLLSLFARAIVYFFRYTIYRNSFLLCASAFASYDYSRTLTFKDKCYKWGYFSHFDYYKKKEDLLKYKNNNKVTILWTGRFLSWKHPESMIVLAKNLIKQGIDFEINMIGVGEEFENIQCAVKCNNLDTYIHMLGSRSPDDVRKYMLSSNIFAFTSDRGEGWGVVLNEAMNSGCAIVAGSNIGSVPYLITNRHNGLIFKSNDWDDLSDKVACLISEDGLKEKLGFQAYKTIEKLWNPRVAAFRAIQLFKSVLNNDYLHYEEGPCSIAEILKDGWFDE